MAYTAGQMVWRLDLKESPRVFLGLYHSIFRNSIPVFVDRAYYLDTVRALFEQGESPDVMEAKLRGRLVPFDSNVIQEFIENNGLEDGITPRIIRDAGRSPMAVFVDGRDTKIEYAGPARYLDGDIWVAVESDSGQSFVSRFLDLADPADVAQERKDLRDEVGRLLPGGRIVFQFDEVDKLDSLVTRPV